MMNENLLSYVAQEKTNQIDVDDLQTSNSSSEVGAILKIGFLSKKFTGFK